MLKSPDLSETDIRTHLKALNLPSRLKWFGPWHTIGAFPIEIVSLGIRISELCKSSYSGCVQNKYLWLVYSDFRGLRGPSWQRMASIC